jgi:flavin reductase (DIM6/NTAB) family NADH-FMN oxidoreductase RutF
VTAPIAVSAADFRAVMSRFCTGITVITAVHDGRTVGFSCQAFSSLSLDPPMVLLCPSKTSTSWPSIASARYFTVNVLSADQQALCQAFAISGTDKFAGVPWRPSARTLAPVLSDVVAAIDCELDGQHEAGDHWIATARVLGLEHDHVAEPLLFFGGEYRALQRRGHAGGGCPRCR